MSLIMSCKAKCIEIKKKSKASGFKNIKEGDILEFLVPIKSAGGGRAIYATYITVKNINTGEQGLQSFTQLSNILDNYEFEQIGDE